MKKRFPHRDTAEPITTAELWRQWESRSLMLSHTDTTKLNLTRKADVYDWLYSIGIQPDRYIVRKASYGRGHIEIRFSHAEDVAFIKMAGIIPEQKRWPAPKLLDKPPFLQYNNSIVNTSDGEIAIIRTISHRYWQAFGRIRTMRIMISHHWGRIVWPFCWLFTPKRLDIDAKYSILCI